MPCCPEHNLRTSGEIAAQVEEGSALATYWVGSAATYLWLITHDGFQSFVIDSTLEQMRPLVSVWIDNLQARGQQRPGEGLAERAKRYRPGRRGGEEQRTETREAAAGVPVAGLKDIDRIYIVPDGPLSSMPFAALRIRGHRFSRPGEVFKNSDFSF